MPICFAPSSVQLNNQFFLGPDVPPGPVKIQDLYLRDVPVDKREQIARQWVLQHDVPGQRVQAVEGLAHAHRMAV